MRLRSLISALENEFPDVALWVTILGKCGIRTTMDLVFGGTSEVLHARLPPSTIEFTDFVAFQEYVIVLVSDAGETGVQAYAREHSLEAEQVSGCTGIKPLDDLVGAGWGLYGIIEVSGSAASFLASFVVMKHLASQPDVSTLWIDTMGEFSVEQASLVLGGLSEPTDTSALDRFHLSLCFTMSAVDEALDSLRHTLDLEASDDHTKPSRMRYVVIDSLNHLLMPLLKSSSGSSQGHAILTTFMRQIASIARSYRLTFIVINNAVACTPYNPESAFVTTLTKPGLGPTFTYMSDITLWLTTADNIFGEDDPLLQQVQDPAESQNSGRRVYIAEILRSRVSLTRDWCPFVIRDFTVLEPLQLQ